MYQTKFEIEEILKEIKKFTQEDLSIFLENEKVDISTRINLDRKKIEDILEDEKIPITIDVMFKTIIFNKERKEYAIKLLSYFFDKIDNFEFVKNELDKNMVEDKDKRGDFVARVDGINVAIEMNYKNELVKSIEYLNNIFSKDIHVGSSYIHDKVILINLNNYTRIDNNRIIDVYSFISQSGEYLTPVKIIDIYLPNIKLKYERKEELTELERFDGNDRNKCTRSIKNSR